MARSTAAIATSALLSAVPALGLAPASAATTYFSSCAAACEVAR